LIQDKTASGNSFEPNQDGELLVWKLDRELSQAFIVGEGNVLYLSGWCYHPRSRIQRLSVMVDGRPHRVLNHSIGDVEALSGQPPHLDKTGESLTSGFWTTISFDEINNPATVELRLCAALADGEICESLIGTLVLIPTVERRPLDYSLTAPEVDGEPLVAICMGTYNPPLDLFTSQLESLIKQTHRNWVCIINDDYSSEAHWEGIQRIAAMDRRFVLYRNAERLGFYRNFERCLCLAPSAARFIALADQDDYWYPDKLKQCLAAFRDEINMVYSDLEVTTPDAEVIAKTLWAKRENNYTDLEALLYANTVTGAAIVFRADLLDELLPFPHLPGNSYHDHWIACVALTKGAIGYVDKPLYAWRQHEANACGFAATQPAVIKKWMELKTFAYLLVMFLRLATHFGAYLTCLRQQYESYFVGVVVLAQVLRVRVKSAPEDKRAILERFSNFERSLLSLARQAVKCRILKRATLGRELTCFRVALSVRLFNIYCRLARRLFYRRRTDSMTTVQTSPAARINS
jgi:glycosyltransferase involved in cell wall biosynthesis